MAKMVMLPAEATEEMREAADLDDYLSGVVDSPAQKVYAAMTAASPLAGKVSRGVLREAHKAAVRAGREAWQQARPGDSREAVDRAFLDALAAALGLEVAED